VNLDFKHRGQIEGLQGGAWIAQAIQSLINAVGAGWDTQHNGDGSHSVATFGSATGPSQRAGSGTPEGKVTAPVGSVYMRTDGGTGSTFYVKQSGTAATGWVAMGGATLLKSVTTLTNAQIKALPSATVQLTVAPASGYKLRIFNATVVKRGTAGAYTNVNAAAIFSIEYGNYNWAVNPIYNDATQTAFTTRLTDFLGVADDGVHHLAEFAQAGNGTVGNSGGAQWNQAGGYDYPSSFDGQAAVVRMDNAGSGNLTGGNAANTMTITLYYVVEAI